MREWKDQASQAIHSGYNSMATWKVLLMLQTHKYQKLTIRVQFQNSRFLTHYILSKYMKYRLSLPIYSSVFIFETWRFFIEVWKRSNFDEHSRESTSKFDIDRFYFRALKLTDHVKLRNIQTVAVQTHDNMVIVVEYWTMPYWSR